MASSSAPKHDFAPAWLKIPTNAQRPSGAGSGDSSLRHEDSAINSHAHATSKSRNSSLDVRRDRSRSGFPYRHHSIDTDDPQHLSPTSGSSSSEYRLSSSQRQQSGSQPSLGRRPLSRQDFRDSLSPSFSTASKAFGSGASDSHRSNSNHWGRQRSFEHNHGGGSHKNSAADLNHASAKESGSWNNHKINKFDQEFPSLKGGKAEDAVPTPSAVNGSVWDTSKTGKIHLSSSVSKKLHLVQKPIRNDITKRSTSPGGSVYTGSGNGSPKSVPHATILKQTAKSGSNSSSSSTSVYRTLMPVKGAMIRRPSKDSVKLNGPSSKGGSRLSPTPASEILNTRLVTHPKNLGNKSDFLKELRDDGSALTGIKIGDDCNQVEGDSDELGGGGHGNEADGSHKPCFEDGRNERQDLALDKIQNGIGDHAEETAEYNCLQVSFRGINIERTLKTEHADTVALSRSLEAEQRLLREMGWTEEGSEDEGVYAPLTEAEMKEIESLSKTIPKRNGFQRNQQFTWSPKRILTFPKAADLANESSGSTSSDSDSD